MVIDPLSESYNSWKDHDIIFEYPTASSNCHLRVFTLAHYMLHSMACRIPVTSVVSREVSRKARLISPELKQEALRRIW